MNAEDRIHLLELELAYVRAEYQEYCSAISHDLSAPLRIMGGFSEIILSNNEGVFDEKTQRHFSFIMTSAVDAKAMLDSLREFSHLQRNNADFIEFESEALVQSVLETVTEEQEISDAEINVGKLPTVKGDREQIRLVFYHLLKNALLYRHPTVAPVISITCSDLGKHLEFKVIDNGIGVPIKMDERIFQVLKRAVSPKEYPGHGMGLAIAKKIIHRHGGKIQLQRDIPKKTVFRFTLPKNPIAI